MEEDPIIQVGFLKVQFQRKDLIMETISRFSQSMLDISISPTSIYFLGSTKFIAEDTPYEKFQTLISTQFITFFDDDILPNRNVSGNLRLLLSELREITINLTYRRIEKQLTEKAVNIVKEKIKSLCNDAMK